MKLIQQRKRIKISNAEPFSGGGGAAKRRHSTLLPNSIRAVISGPSNCGKTNLMICLLFDPNGLKFKNLYLFTKTPFQPKYEFLRKVFSRLKNINFYLFSENANIVEPSKAKKDSVFIFDDLACENQRVIRQYFCMGRHSGVDSFLLGQTYSHIPKHLIRENANLLIVFRQDEGNLKNIYTDHVGTDMSFNDFKNICSVCWTEKFGFLVIDKESELNSGRYRKGFDTFITSI